MRNKNRKALRAKTALASILDHLEPRVLFTGTITDTSLDGSWFYSGMNQGSTVTINQADVMSVGPVTFAFDAQNTTGSNMTSSIVSVAGTTVTPKKQRFDVDPDGKVTIDFTFDTDNDPNTDNDVVTHYIGALNSTQDVITLTVPGTTLTAGILVKGTASAFALADLNGTWSVFDNGDNAGSTGSGTLIFNGQGQITGGSIKSGTQTLTVLAGAYTITSAGVVRATVFALGPNGQKMFEYAGQLNPSRDVVGVHPQNLAAAKTAGDPLISTWIRRAATTPQSTMAGSWTVSGNGFGGNITVDAAGKITGGTFTNALGHANVTASGKLTIVNGTLTLNLTLNDAGVITNIIETGVLNASRNIGAVEKAPSSAAATASTASLTFLSRAGNHAPTLTKVNKFAGAIETTPFAMTFAQLLAASDAFDTDNDALGIIIQSVTSGTVKVNNVAVVPGTTTMHAGDTLTWTPAAGSGLVSAFNIRVTDGVTPTTNDVAVSVNTVKLPVVSIVATKKTATEIQGKPNNFVQYRISRTGGILSQPLTVSFNATGTLPLDGSAFTTTSAIANFGTVTIPAGKSFILITLKPLDNAVADAGGKRELTLTLATAGIREIDTFTPLNPTTGDVYAITITFPDLTTKVISATVGATQTATDICNLLRTAWAADPVASAYATASGTATFILTSTTPGTAMNVTAGVTGTGTIGKVVTTPASGASNATNAYTITPTVPQKSAKITILDHNEPPTINITGNKTGAHLNTPFTMTFAELVTATNADDREDVTLTFKIRALVGTLTGANAQGFVSVTTAGSLTWTPPTGRLGVVSALSIQVFDGVNSSKFQTLKIVVV